MSEGKLFVKDSRTSLEYEIKIHRNSIPASAFKEIRAPAASSSRVDKAADGLRVYDPGLQNTAVVETSTSFALSHPKASIGKKNSRSNRSFPTQR